MEGNTPVHAAEFFNAMRSAFFEHLRWIDEPEPVTGFVCRAEPGIFGHIAWVMAPTEAQNRGSLHSHMVICLVSVLLPQEFHCRAKTDPLFRDRVNAFTNAIPHNQLLPASIDCHRNPTQEYWHPVMPEWTPHPCTVMPQYLARLRHPGADHSLPEAELFLRTLNEDANSVVLVTNVHTYANLLQKVK